MNRAMDIFSICAIKRTYFESTRGEMKESDFEIGIIGGTGDMGRWCADLLRKQGYSVHVSGRTSGPSMEEMAARCAVIIVSVPIESTKSVVSAVGALMPKTSLLMDLTSLKEAPLRSMLEATKAEVMGCHPLFGPKADLSEDLGIVICPGRVRQWASWPGEVFRNAGLRVIETTPEKHDKMMALVQGLNHLDSMIMAMIIKRTGIGRIELEEYATPLFRSKLDIIDRVMSGSPRMYAEIIAGNSHVKEIFGYYEEILMDLKTIIERGDGSALAEIIIQLRSSSGKDS